MNAIMEWLVRTCGHELLDRRDRLGGVLLESEHAA
jgi:hypothetical protein